jgi:Zn finger protein HypA/HybF involved in hydrogenase expression
MSTEWRTSNDAVPDGHVQITVHDEATGRRIATVFEEVAYASLIAKAPLLIEAREVLEACRDCLDWENNPSTEKLVRALLAKLDAE